MGDMVRVGGEGKLRTGGAFHPCYFSPRVIFVRSNQGLVIALGLGIVASIDRHHVALQILRVIIAGKSGFPGVFHTYANDCAVFIMQEHQRADKGSPRFVLRLCQQHGTHPVVVGIRAVGVGFSRPQTNANQI